MNKIDKSLVFMIKINYDKNVKSDYKALFHTFIKDKYYFIKKDIERALFR